MKKYLLISAIFCLLTSCASIVNNKDVKIYVYTEKPSHILFMNDTIHTEKYEELNAATLTVPRSKDSLQFELLNDSMSRKVSIPSKISSLYYLNIVSPPFWPGLLIDLSSPKRYTYKNVLAFDDTLSLSRALIGNRDVTENQKANMIRKHNNTYNIYGRSRKDRLYTKQGDVFLYFAVPFIYPSYTIIKPEPSSSIEKGSVLGFAGGIDYYYKKNRFVNLSASMTAGGDIVFGCGFYEFDDSERFNLYNLTISNNHRYKRFSFGYGISHSYVDWWEEKYFKNPFAESNIPYHYHYSWAYYLNRRKYSNLGFIFNGYFYFFNDFSVGIVYKPTFVRLNSIMEKKIYYEHQISLDFAIKVRLNKRK